MSRRFAELRLRRNRVGTSRTRCPGPRPLIEKGIEAGMKIVSSGQNKLSNGSHIVIDNSVSPTNATADATQ